MQKTSTRTPSSHYAHALSVVEGVLCHLLWDPVPMNATVSRQKNDFVNLSVTLISGKN